MAVVSLTGELVDWLIGELKVDGLAGETGVLLLLAGVLGKGVGWSDDRVVVGFAGGVEDELEEIVGAAGVGTAGVSVNIRDVVDAEWLVGFKCSLLTEEVLEAVNVKMGPFSGLSSGLGAAIIWKSASGMSQQCALLSAKPQQY